LSLRIPDVSRATNSASTYRTYQPSEIIGSTTPQGIDSGPPPPVDDCGAFKQFLVIVVAVAVTAYLGPAAANWLASTGGAFTTGAVTAAGAAVPSAAAYAVGGAAAAAAGSVASQTVGMAVGLQDSFSWKAVGMAALGGAISGGMQGLGAESKAFATWMKQNPALSAMAANAMTQGIGVMTGLQEKFSWQSVAVSGASAWINSQIPNGRPDARGTLQPLSSPEKLVRNFLTGTTTQIIRMAVYGQGKLDFASLAADAFGNVIGESLADSMKPKADSPYSLAGSGAKLGNGGGSVRLGTGDDGSSVGGGEYPGSQAWADDVAARRASASAQQVPLRQMLGLFATADDGFSSAQDDMRQQFADVYGDDFGFVQTGGGNGPGLMRGGGPYRPGSLIELSRNGGRDAAMQSIDDAIAFAGMVGDYRTLGNVIQLRSQVGAMNRELADIDRDLVALGKKPPAIGPDMMAPGDELRVLAYKLTERRNFVRLVAYENLGVLRLNEDLSIRDIGKDRLSPKDFLKELGQVAERSVAAWAREADGMASRGELSLGRYFFAGDNAEVVAKGDVVDRGYKRDIADWLSNQRIPEGPFGRVSINRRYNDPQSANNYRIPDVLVNYGPREVYALDATLAVKTICTPQVRDALGYGVTQWGNVTRAGLDWIYNTSLPRGRR
jgi:hypothetical protein